MNRYVIIGAIMMLLGLGGIYQFANTSLTEPHNVTVRCGEE